MQSFFYNLDMIDILWRISYLLQSTQILAYPTFSVSFVTIVIYQVRTTKPILSFFSSFFFFFFFFVYVENYIVICYKPSLKRQKHILHCLHIHSSSLKELHPCHKTDGLMACYLLIPFMLTFANHVFIRTNFVRNKFNTYPAIRYITLLQNLPKVWSGFMFFFFGMSTIVKLNIFFDI